MKQLEATLKKWLMPLHKDVPPLYLVGGIVRDHLLSMPGKDIDLMCQHAEKFARKLAGTRNAVVVPFEKKADEPCYRVVDPDHQGDFLDIAAMRGDTVWADLSRRDFTINAIAIQIDLDGTPGEIIDPLNGQQDLAQKIIRMASSQAFVSDPLRILRAIRFAAKLGFVIEDETLAAMKTYASHLKNVANERILYELIEIFNTKATLPFVRLMDKLGILEIIFPEISAMKDCKQNGFHHLDVWNHSLLVLEHCEDILNHLQDMFGDISSKVSDNLKPHYRMPLLKLTAMLHDVGKPSTQGLNEATNRITFYGHDKVGAEIAFNIAQRLRMSKRHQDFICTLIREHLHILHLSGPKVKSVTRMRWFRKLREDSIPSLILGMADIQGTRGSLSDEASRAKHAEWSKNMINSYYGKIKKRLERRNLITGKDLIAMGMSPGPEFGRILRTIREAQDTGMIKTGEDALLLVKELRSAHHS